MIKLFYVIFVIFMNNKDYTVCIVIKVEVKERVVSDKEMVKILKCMKNIPNEMQEIIWNYYWSWYMQDIHDEITVPIKLENRILHFISRYVKQPVFLSENYMYHLQIFNRRIKKLLNTPLLKITCVTNNLYLRYCYNVPQYVKNTIHDSLMYIAYFFYVFYGHTKLHMLSSLSRIYKNYQ